MRAPARCWFTLALASSLACGYHLVDERAAFGPDVTQIRLRMFDNRTAEPGLERMLGDAIHEEFLRGGTLEPIYDGGDGDALELSGVIRRVEVRASAVDSVGLSLENEIELTIDVEVARAATGDAVWMAEDMSDVERFSASADANVFHTYKEQALRRLSSQIASRIRNELFQSR